MSTPKKTSKPAAAKAAPVSSAEPVAKKEYVVIERFKDRDGKIYKSGSKWSGTDARVKVLLGDNSYKRPFIREV